MPVSSGEGADRRKSVCEQLWLIYYNRILFEAGLISERERNRMANRIHARPSAAQGAHRVQGR